MGIEPVKIKPAEMLKSFLGFSLSSIIGFFIGIISVPILTRLLLPEHFAAINQFYSAINFFVGLVCLGLDSVFVRYYHEPPEGIDYRQLFTRCILICSGVLFAIAIVTIPFYKHIGFALIGVHGKFITLFIVLSIQAHIIIRFVTINCRMENSIIAYTIIMVSLQLVSKFAALIALPFGINEKLLITACTAGLVALGLGSLGYAYKKGLFKFSQYKIIKNREVVKYSLSSWPVPVVLFANIYISQLLIRIIDGPVILGIFLSANIFVSILGVFQGGFATFWSAFMFKNYNTEQSIIIKVHDYICLFAVCIMCFLIYSRDLIYLFIGSDYQQSKYIFALVVTVPLFNLINETTAYGISIAKRAHLTFLSYGATFLINLILMFFLTQFFGMYGAGLALLISSIFNLAIQTFFGQMFYKSVHSLYKTIFSTLLLIFLANLNYFANSNLFLLLTINTVVLIIALVAYSKIVFEILTYLINFFIKNQGNA